MQLADIYRSYEFRVINFNEILNFCVEIRCKRGSAIVRTTAISYTINSDFRTAMQKSETSPRCVTFGGIDRNYKLTKFG
jgi:hypothetical protein